MSASDKKFIIELPLKVILTEDGASNFISHNKKLMRFRLADNVDEYGISLNKFSPQSIQSMILLDYISKIEISMSEFVSSCFVTSGSNGSFKGRCLFFIV